MIEIGVTERSFPPAGCRDRIIFFFYLYNFFFALIAVHMVRQTASAPSPQVINGPRSEAAECHVTVHKHTPLHSAAVLYNAGGKHGGSRGAGVGVNIHVVTLQCDFLEQACMPFLNALFLMFLLCAKWHIN